MVWKVLFICFRSFPSFLFSLYRIAFIILFSFHNVGRKQGSIIYVSERDNRILSIFLANDDCGFPFFANYLLVTISTIHKKDIVDRIWMIGYGHEWLGLGCVM